MVGNLFCRFGGSPESFWECLVFKRFLFYTCLILVFTTQHLKVALKPRGKQVFLCDRWGKPLSFGYTYRPVMDAGCFPVKSIDLLSVITYNTSKMAIPKAEEKYTYEDYLSWPQDERWELIRGIPYAMSPAPSRLHQQILVELVAQMHDFLKGKSCEVYSAPFDVRLPEASGKNDTVVQPDISVICDQNKLDELGCQGAPDLVVEILSPATASRDLREKLMLYEESGVKEYWVVDPHDRVVLVFSPNRDRQFGKPQVYSASDTIESVAVGGIVIKLESVFIK